MAIARALILLLLLASAGCFVLFVFTSDPRSVSLTSGKGWFAYLYPGDDKYTKTADPVSPFCDCPACARYSLAYLHHLFKVNDALYLRLATMHNLRFMTMLMERLRRKPWSSAKK